MRRRLTGRRLLRFWSACPYVVPESARRSCRASGRSRWRSRRSSSGQADRASASRNAARAPRSRPAQPGRCQRGAHRGGRSSDQQIPRVRGSSLRSHGRPPECDGSGDGCSLRASARDHGGQPPGIGRRYRGQEAARTMERIPRAPLLPLANDFIVKWLSDLRVLDLSQYLPGPFATRLLADMGADVVKVEPPGGEPGRHFDLEGKPGVSPFWRVLNSGKTVVILDLVGPRTAGAIGADRARRRAARVLSAGRSRPARLRQRGCGAQPRAGPLRAIRLRPDRPGSARVGSRHQLPGDHRRAEPVRHAGRPVIPFPPSPTTPAPCRPS